MKLVIIAKDPQSWRLPRKRISEACRTLFNANRVFEYQVGSLVEVPDEFADLGIREGWVTAAPMPAKREANPLTLERLGLHPAVKARYLKSCLLLLKQFHDDAESVARDKIIRLLEQCERARKYDWQNDPRSMRRKSNRDALGEGAPETAASEARNVARLLHTYPDQFMFAVAAAETGSGLRLAMPQGDGVAIAGGNPAIHLASVLEAFAAALDEGIFVAKRGPFEHRFRHGPLLYPEPIDSGKLPEPPTVLGLLLAFLFRLESTQQKFAQAGQKNPSSGSPRWAIVTSLINDALDQDFSEEDIRSKIRKFERDHPGIRFMDYSR